MMEAHLGVTTCDKCGKPMEQEQPILVVAEGDVTEPGDELELSKVLVFAMLVTLIAGMGLRRLADIESIWYLQGCKIRRDNW